jgi:hypothetical protein
MEVPLIDLSGLYQKKKKKKVHMRGNSKEMKIIIWHKWSIKRGAAFLGSWFVIV